MLLDYEFDEFISLMKKSQVLDYFGGVNATAVALRITPSAVSQWKERIPLTSAYWVEKITKGKLSVDPEDYRHQ